MMGTSGCWMIKVLKTSTIALRALGFAESMSGDGLRGPYDGMPRSKDYFATLLQQPDEI